MRFSLNSPDDAPYDRPHQPWRCGLSHEGSPCPLGPTRGGACPGASACHPVRDGDRWRCNRSALRGGPCADGPGPQGECAIHYRCTPFRSLRSRRGQLVSAIGVAAAGALCILLAADWRREAIAPGPLSVHHAQLLTGDRAAERCAACHEAERSRMREGEAPVEPNAVAGIGSTGASPSHAVSLTQTSLCMECHDKSFPREFAFTAHSLAAIDLPRKDGAPRRDPDKPIACRACHCEHQGREHDLTATGDTECQACHATRYESFAADHPEFAAWPSRRRTRIAFDHGAHQAKHFPDKQHEFVCALCHELEATTGRMVTHGYDATCRECHDAGIATSLAQGIDVFTLPTLDVDALADAGHAIGAWPEDAQGDFDGSLSPLAKLLIADDPDGAVGWAELGPRFDFFDIDFEDEQQLAAAAQVIAAYKRTLARLARGDEAALALVPGLPAETIHAWLDQTLPDAAPARGGSAEASPSPTNASPPVPSTAPAATSQVAGPRGPWRTAPDALAVRYAPAGHADAVLRTWFDSLAAAATGPHAGVADPLLRDLAKPTAPGQCGSCHSLERDAAGRLAMQWRADQGERPGAASLTTFSHAPHLTQADLRDCAACHQLAAGADVTTTYAHDSADAFTPGFAPLHKADCAACHRPQAAGDSCTQCHRYHGGDGGGSR